MKLRYILATGLLVTVLFACQKKNTRIDYNNGIEGAKLYVAAQQMMVQLLNTYFKSLTDSTLLSSGRSTIDGADIYYYAPPEERILIKYPTWGAADGYGHWRINTYEAIPQTSFNDPDVSVDIIFNDFLYDKDTLDVQNLVVKYLGNINDGDDHYRISVEKINLTYRDTTGVMTFALNQEFARHKDPGTQYTSPDDYFIITGTLNGISKDLLGFQSTITSDSAVINSFSCNWLKGGMAKVETERFNFPAFVYYPDPDTCLNEYDIVINDDPFPYPFDM